MHFTRFLVLLLLLSKVVPLASQAPAMEINWHYQEGQDQKIELWISPEKGLPLEYQLLDAEIISVRLSEGRLKKPLDYSYQQDRLKIRVPGPLDQRARIYVKYQIAWSEIQESPFISLLKPGLALNALNMEEESPSGIAGLLFPAPASGKAQKLSLALVCKEGLNLELPLELDIIVRDGARISRFFISEEPLQMEKFYLAIGDFRRFDPDDVLSSLEEQKEALADQKLTQFQSRHQALIDYIAQEKPRIFTRDEIKELMTLEDQGLRPFFPALLEIAGQGMNATTKELSILQRYFPAQWKFHWAELNRRRLSPSVWKSILKKHWKQGDSSAVFWQFYIENYLSDQGLSWQDTVQSTLTKRQKWYLDQAEYFLHRKRPISLNLSYRMKHAQNKMAFYIEHEDTSSVLPFNLAGEAILKSDTILFTHWLWVESRDTVFVELDESPRALYLKSDSTAFIQIIEERPLNFLLFDLSQRQKPKQRRQALLALLETSNSRLLATVIGIALDSDDRELQLLALQKVNKLKPEGRQKIQSSLESLAQQNKDVKIKQKAQALLKFEP